MSKNFISLYELTSKIKQVIDTEFWDSLWIMAEISELKVNQRGHCYIDLIEKDKTTDTIIAKVRATIWASQFRMLKPYFESTTGVEFTEGLKILTKVSVTFHEQYGFSLNIRDIDPSFTIGELELKRKQTIEQLKQDGVFYLNKEINIVDIPKNIAIISSETAAGYGDFVKQLNNNSYGFRFNHYLFNSIMQGNNAEASIISALEKIYKYDNIFDCVVIIRGGGAKTDLSCFDSYNLAYNIAQFPLPVISGIGHDRDESIVDMVSNVSVKTPTAAAEFLISKFVDVYSDLENLKDFFIDTVNEKIKYNNDILNRLSYNFSNNSKDFLKNKRQKLLINIRIYNNVFKSYFDYQNNKINNLDISIKHKTQKLIENKKQEQKLIADNLKTLVRRYINNKINYLKIIEIKNNSNNPNNLLKKGYTLTYSGNKLIKSKNDIKTGDKLKTVFCDGKIISKVE